MSRTYSTISKAYLETLSEIYYRPDFSHLDTSQPHQRPEANFNRGAFQEKIDYSFTILSPSREEQITTKCPIRNQVIADYAKKERILFDSGDIWNLGSLSKVWATIANPDGSVNANYGYMVYHLKDAGNLKFSEKMASQWEWAKSRLLKFEDTLQAYLHFNRPKDQWDENLDQPCTMYIQFIIRRDVSGIRKLHLYAYMRSNDAVYGLPYNVLYFVELMYRMREELCEKYPDLEIGNYVHRALSLHIYTKHLKKVQEMIQSEEILF